MNLKNSNCVETQKLIEMKQTQNVTKLKFRQNSNSDKTQ